MVLLANTRAILNRSAPRERILRGVVYFKAGEERPTRQECLCMDLQVGNPTLIESLSVELAGANELRLAGRLNSDTAQSELRRHLEELHEHIVGQKISPFTVDLRELNLVNSSALRLFIDWISRAESARYKLVFKTDRSITWHRLSFSVLKSLSPSFVEIV